MAKDRQLTRYSQPTEKKAGEYAVDFRFFEMLSKFKRRFRLRTGKTYRVPIKYPFVHRFPCSLGENIDKYMTSLRVWFSFFEGNCGYKHSASLILPKVQGNQNQTTRSRLPQSFGRNFNSIFKLGGFSNSERLTSKGGFN